MEAVQKEKNIKPVEAKVTDIGIMLECLHEVYESEGGLLLSGKTLRSTMVYPFIKMIEAQCQGISAKEIHQLLWNIYLVKEGKSLFVKVAKDQLEQYEKGLLNRDYI